MADLRLPFLTSSTVSSLGGSGGGLVYVDDGVEGDRRAGGEFLAFFQSGGGWSRAAYVHIGQGVAGGFHHAAHYVFVHLADHPDAETVHNGEFAGIDDEPACFHGVIKALKGKVRISGAEEGHDDRAEPAVGEQRLEPSRGGPPQRREQRRDRCTEPAQRVVDDRLQQAEADFRAVLKQDPDNARTLNALGYTLADRTDRYDEALALIEKALAQTPDDPAVIDSMGWVMFRLGRLQEAREYLQRAYDMTGDGEIAAHLGEVLWVMGDREAARALWEKARETAPDNPVLKDTLRRFVP